MELVHTIRNVSLSYLSPSFVIPYAAEDRVVRVHSRERRSTERAAVAGGGGLSGANSSSSYVHVQSKPAAYLTDGDLDGPDGAGPDAWATHSVWGWVVDQQHAPDVRQGRRWLETQRTLAADQDQPSVAFALAYSRLALGDLDGALDLLDDYDWDTRPDEGVVDGDAAVTERIRGRVIQGMCCEMGSQADYQRAVELYLDAVAMTESLRVSPLIEPTYLVATGPNAPKPAIPNFEAQREILRWLSLALTRAAALCAHSDQNQLTLRILRTYHALSINWAPSFRARQRQRMLNLYVSALETSYPSSGSRAPEPYLLRGSTPSRTARTIWRGEVTEALRCGQRLLGETTSFPRAGEYNHAVVSFANRAAQFPALSQSLARDAVNVLWWATQLTYHSQSVMRNLARLLEVTGEVKEARRVFELYVQLVLKARETENPDHPLKLQRHPTDTDEKEAPGAKRGSESSQDEFHSAKEEAGGVVHDDADIDTDDQFVQGLNVGALMLLRHFNDSADAWRYATLASDVTKRGKVTPFVAARAEEVKGIVRLCMSNSGEAVGTALLKLNERGKRKQLQSQALAHLRKAVAIDPNSVSAYYHLAYAYAVSRQIDLALGSVRHALELDSHAVRCWHLLALLLTATGDWQAARKAAETGASLWETTDEAAMADEGDLPYAGQPPSKAAHALLQPNGDLTPTPAIPDAKPGKDERLREILQLRMTLNTIVEKLDGPDAALVRQQELFKFFSSRTDPMRPAVGAPAGGGAALAPALSIGTVQTVQGQQGRDERLASDLGGSYILTPPHDVQVSPPTPAAASIATATPGAGSSPSPGTPNSGVVESEDERRHKRSLLPKHLHVPSVARSHTKLGRGHPEGLAAEGRNLSASSLSIAPTAIHSHYHSRQARAAPPPPPPLQRSGRTPAEERMLADLWLQSAATFRRAGKLEQCLVAVEEAEAGDPANPAIWVQLGALQEAEARSGGSATGRTAPLGPMQLNSANPGPTSALPNGSGAPLSRVVSGGTIGSSPGVGVTGWAAPGNGNPAATGVQEGPLASYTKALLLRPDYPAALVCIARLHARAGDFDNANGLLNQLVHDAGWDCAEAWYLLGVVAERQGRRDKAREYLNRAMEMQGSRTARGVEEALGLW